MVDHGKRTSGEVALPRDGHGVQSKKSEARYCAICGEDATLHGLAVERFGEVFCSDGHAEEFVREVRAARVQAAANALAVQPADADAQQSEKATAGASKPRDWKHYLKMGACCGAPLLALVLLAGGGGALLGAAGTLLPLLAVLACPLGMYFMMRSMAKTEKKENPRDEGDGK